MGCTIACGVAGSIVLGHCCSRSCKRVASHSIVLRLVNEGEAGVIGALITRGARAAESLESRQGWVPLSQVSAALLAP